VVDRFQYLSLFLFFAKYFRDFTFLLWWFIIEGNLGGEFPRSVFWAFVISTSPNCDWSKLNTVWFNEEKDWSWPFVQIKRHFFKKKFYEKIFLREIRRWKDDENVLFGSQRNFKWGFPWGKNPYLKDGNGHNVHCIENTQKQRIRFFSNKWQILDELNFWGLN